MDEPSDVLIVGTGHGGAQTAISLRQHKFDGSITLVGAERDYPYERPPLSKEYLAGEKVFDRILLRPEHFWADRHVEMRLGQRVIAVDPYAKNVTLESGDAITFRTLVWAGGGTPRSLTCGGGDLAGVHAVRTRADVDQLISELPRVSRVVVIGGGYIGLESAAILRKLGKTVIVLEAFDRVLSRVAGAPVSHFYEAEHRRQGVEVRTGISVECIEGRDGAVTGVRLSDDEVILAELVIVGIGITPSIEPLRAAGAASSNGVHVDEHCRTNLPDVYAIGDCALHRSRYADDQWIRLESVQNANDQAQTTARAIIGDPQPYETVPWFWSNQYDLRLQTVGLSVGFDDLIVRGAPSTRSFSVVYLRNERVIALDCINAVKDYAQGKALVQSGSTPPKHLLANSEVALKSLSE